MEPVAPDQTKPKRRRWQFSLRVLLIFNALVTIVIGAVYLVPRYQAHALAEQLAAEPDDVRRAKIAEALLAIGRPAFGATVSLLKNKNPKVRWNAVTVLGRMKDEGAIPHLIEALIDDAVVKLEIRVHRGTTYMNRQTGETVDPPPMRIVTTVAGVAVMQLSSLQDARLDYVISLLDGHTQDTSAEAIVWLIVHSPPEENRRTRAENLPASWLPAVRKLEAKYPPKKSPSPPVK